MRYYKTLLDGYIISIGDGPNGVEITEQEYNDILDAITNVPTSPSGFSYRLKNDLSWELVEHDPPDPDPELDGDDVLEILLGGAEE